MIDLDDWTSLACPRCKGSVTEEAQGAELRCLRCGVRYPVRDGFPILLAEEALDVRPLPVCNRSLPPIP
jgi:uncharacterized protein YbaR (Trm112 family)